MDSMLKYILNNCYKAYVNNNNGFYLAEFYPEDKIRYLLEKGFIKPQAASKYLNSNQLNARNYYITAKGVDFVENDFKDTTNVAANIIINGSNNIVNANFSITTNNIENSNLSNELKDILIEFVNTLKENQYNKNLMRKTTTDFLENIIKNSTSEIATKVLTTLITSLIY
ncbi:MAG: hypothetical protein V8S74_08275 [Lachnospirales bacterium]